MDYKKIIRSYEMRQKILGAMAWIPDKAMLKLQYRIKTGRKLNLKDPQRFTEKLQWYKHYYRDPLMIQCVDKYDVREYVRSKGLESILNECYGIYNRIEDIDFDALPDQFILKDTLGGGGNSVIICRDKTTFDTDAAKKQMQKWLDTNLIKSGGREWPYYSGKMHRIIIDRYLENPENPEAGISDYKFFCYQGKVIFLVVDRERYIEHKRNFYDVNWNYLNVTSDHESFGDIIEKPEGYEMMIKVAQELSKDFPFVRVDLYSVGGKVYFGELTYYPWSGYVQFTPDEFDFELGKHFIFPKRGH
jgi:hypothetical protein